MNFMEAGGINAAKNVMGGNMEGTGNEIKNLVNQLKDNPLVKDYFAAQAVSAVGGNVSAADVLARGSGQVLNPNMELLFKGPTIRNFSFTFKFTPRFQKEAQTVRTIIKAFKRNMAPEGSGAAMIKTPKVFEIQYLSLIHI